MAAPVTLAPIPADITLGVGNHERITQGACIMELVSHLAGEPWSDHPACVPHTVAAYKRTLNDWMPDGERQRLLAYIERIVGLDQSPAAEQRRAYRAADRAVRVHAPAALAAAGRTPSAERLRRLAPITDELTARTAADAAAAAYAAANAAANAADAAAAAADWDAALTTLDQLIAA